MSKLKILESSVKQAPKLENIPGKKSIFVKIFLHKKVLIIIGIAVVISAAFLLFFLTSHKKALSKPIAVIDDLPIWLLRDGKVVVYQELVIFEDKVQKQIVVNNLADSEEQNVEIYETVPKEISQHASDLKFNIQPQIIEEDPLVLWNVGPVRRQPVIFSYETKQKDTKTMTQDLKRLNDLIWSCKEDTPPGTPGKYEREEAKVKEMVAVYEKIGQAMDIRDIYKNCLWAYRQRILNAQKQAQQKLETEKNEKVVIIESTESKYAEIQKTAQDALKKIEPFRATWQTSSPAPAPASTLDADKPKAIIRALISKDIFPSTLIGLTLAEVRTSIDVTGCYSQFPPTKYYSGIYKGGNKTAVVVVAQFQDEQTAKDFPKKCTDFTSQSLSSQGITATLENKGIIAAYPFSIATALQDSSLVIISSFTTIADAIIQVSIVPFDGTTETEHREAMTAVVRNVNVGCYGDSDCAGWVCDNCEAGQKICVQQECVACADDSHCKGGYECKDHQCVVKQAVAPIADTSTPPPSSPVCGNIDLSKDYKLYTYTVDTPGYSTVCSEYKNSFSLLKMSLECLASNARWRNYWVKEVEVGGLNKVKITADLGLNDYSRFFTECSGTGVKYDDYSSLIVLSSNPKPTLDVECNKVCSQEDWSKCAVKADAANVLGSCGVPKCSASKKCDFEVNVNGLDKIYLVYHISDAWPADLQGTLENLQVCGQ